MQAIFDIGYIGLLCLIGFVVLTNRAVGKVKTGAVRREPRPLLAVVIFLSMQGITEITFSSYQVVVFSIFISIVLVMLQLRRFPGMWPAK